MAEDRIKLLEERLTRLESVLTQRATGPGAGPGTVPPSGVIVDSAPWAGGGNIAAQLRPVVDPAPYPWGGWGAWHWPRPVVDPAPYHPGVVADPAPFGGHVMAPQASLAARSLGRIGQVGDPAPIDLGSLSISQLESTLHSIVAEKARLESMESMIKKQIDRVQKQGQPG